MENKVTSTDSKGSELAKVLTVATATEQQLKQSLRYAMTVTGCPLDKIPQQEAGVFIIQYLLKHYQALPLQNINEAFDLAVQKKLQGDDGKPLDIKYYDQPFNAAYFSNVMHAYSQYKAANKLAQEKRLPVSDEANNTKERSAAIITVLKEKYPETIGKIYDMANKAKVKKEPKPVAEPTETDKMINGFITEFNNLYDTQHPDGKGVKEVTYKGFEFQLEEYVKMRIKEK